VLRLNPEQLVFVTERHLATLTTLRADGSPHVVPVAFTWDAEAGVARITARPARVRHLDRAAPPSARSTVAGGSPSRAPSP
jgi:hypothetical protein